MKQWDRTSIISFNPQIKLGLYCSAEIKNHKYLLHREKGNDVYLLFYNIGRVDVFVRDSNNDSEILLLSLGQDETRDLGTILLGLNNETNK